MRNRWALRPIFTAWRAEGTDVHYSVPPEPLARGQVPGFFADRHVLTQTGVFHTRSLRRVAVTLACGCFNDAAAITRAISASASGDDKILSCAWLDQRGGYQEWLARIVELTFQPTTLFHLSNHNRAVRSPGYRVDALTLMLPFALFTAASNTSFSLSPSCNDITKTIWTITRRPHGYRGTQHAVSLLTWRRWALTPSTSGGYYGMVSGSLRRWAVCLHAQESGAARQHDSPGFTSDHGCHFKTRNAEYKRACARERHNVLADRPARPGFMVVGRRTSWSAHRPAADPGWRFTRLWPIPTQMQGRSSSSFCVGRAQRGWKRCSAASANPRSRRCAPIAGNTASARRASMAAATWLRSVCRTPERRDPVQPADRLRAAVSDFPTGSNLSTPPTRCGPSTRGRSRTRACRRSS